MKNEHLISIIVPVYNLEKYIAKTLESICSQTYRNIEVIVIDDGSTDDSLNIITEFAQSDERIKCIGQENSGVTSARLKGIRFSTGEFIGFVDGDDAIDVNMYDRLIKNALLHDADISHCGYRMMFGDGRLKYFYNTGCIEDFDRFTGLKELLYGTRIEPGLCNKLFRRKMFLIDSIYDLMDETIKNNEDLLMNYILFSNAKSSVYEDFCPYIYNIRESSASRGELNYNRIFDPIKVKQIIYNICDDNMKNIAKSVYISTCLNSYKATITKKGYKKENYEIRALLLKNKDAFHLMNKKKRLSCFMIRFTPEIYSFIYKIYSNLRKEQKYQ